MHLSRGTAVEISSATKLKHHSNFNSRALLALQITGNPICVAMTFAGTIENTTERKAKLRGGGVQNK